MKIHSITDVITNSSTEVFLLETTKSLSEVSEILGTITRGYLEPEILEKDSGILRILSEDWEYLYDPGSEKDRQRWIYSLLGLTEFGWELCYPEEPMPQDLKEIQCLWRKYVSDNHEYIRRTVTENKNWYGYLSDDPDELYRDLDFLTIGFLPLDFLRDFLRYTWGRELPRIFEIPEKLTLGYWEGKIGFSGSEDNSVPYNDWGKIYKLFGGTHFHLG